MVLDPFSALGLASNIIQFVEFGTRVVSKSVEQYKSAVGASEDLLNSEAVARHLRQLTQGLEGRFPESNDEVGLQKLALSCREVAKELLGMVEDLKVDHKLQGTKRQMQSLRQAFRAVGKEDRIEKLERSMNVFRSEITLHVVMLTRDQGSNLQHELRNLRYIIEDQHINRRDEIEEVLDALRPMTHNPKQAFSVQELSRLHAQLSTAGVTASQISREHGVLSSLHFQSMPIRQSNIKPAYIKTFNWIFESSIALSNGTTREISFKDWLQHSHGGDGIYWIAGKAGSGKSTLMKFVNKHTRTMELLQEWIKPPERLITASHFFWHAGTALQKSHEGLLRSLLYDVLRECPELIPVVCPTRLDVAQTSEPETWGRDELFETFLRLGSQDTISAKFFFLIDGLDEYEGDHFELVEVLGRVATIPNMKMCVSSRPWEVFKAAYDRVHRQRFYLQDLTRNDIEFYVRANLEASEDFLVAKSQDPRYEGFVSKITDKAQGVFLWVFLVVRSLLHGLKSDDTIFILESRLEELPSELETLFQRMLDGVERVYRQKSSRTFQMALTAVEPLSVMAFSLLDEENPETVLRPEIQPLSDSETARRKDRTCKQVNSVSKGLLEIVENPSKVHPYFAYRVDFLHRTVKEFLQEHENILTSSVGAGFECSSYLCLALLGEYKHSPRPEAMHSHDLPVRGSASGLFEHIFYYARQAEIQTEQAQNTVLDELERSILRRKSSSFDKRAGSLMLYDESARPPASFLRACVERGLTLYVRYRISDCPSAIQDEALLASALTGFKSLRYGMADLTNMIHLLLQHGANPNQEYEATTVWGEYLYKVVLLHDDSGKEFLGLEWWMHKKQIINLLLKYGANANVERENSALWGCLFQIDWNWPLFESRTDNIALRIVEDFINHGANPNGRFRGCTVWGQFLGTLSNRASADNSKEANALNFRLAEALIRAGAELGCVATIAENRITSMVGPRRGQLDNARTIARMELEVFRSYFDEQQNARLQGIVDQENVRRKQAYLKKSTRGRVLNKLRMRLLNV
ncbi:MAG: hypothetical protein M1820_003227 [Bogoriella megaspora]|nr:MAG: hypothetical protein M1820_003227 [Bogoriella megaspora]